MKNLKSPITVFMLFLGGCAHIEFDTKDADGLTYFEPNPHVFVTKVKNLDTGACTISAAVMMIPGPKKRMKFHAGWGTSDLSVTLYNGMVSQVGQKGDLKIPETIGAIAGLAGTVASAGVAQAGAKSICEPPAALYKINHETGEVTTIVNTFGTANQTGGVTE